MLPQRKIQASQFLLVATRNLKESLKCLYPWSPHNVRACHTKCGEAPQINCHSGLTLPQLVFSLRKDFSSYVDCSFLHSRHISGACLWKGMVGRSTFFRGFMHLLISLMEQQCSQRIVPLKAPKKVPSFQLSGWRSRQNLPAGPPGTWMRLSQRHPGLQRSVCTWHSLCKCCVSCRTPW